MGVLNRADPEGLEPGAVDGAPVDEYEPEARHIGALLFSRGSVTGVEVDTIWKYYFDDPLTAHRPAIDVAALVRDLNAIPRGQ